MKQKEKIPRVIHYCWFGENKPNKTMTACINSWKKNLPEYKLKEWNEKNFDLESHSFIKKAYEEKRWAFVSDYVRLKVLYEEGGIYLDTDVEVLKSFNDFLYNECFLGFEYNEKLINNAICGAKKHNWFIKECLEVYNNIDEFVQDSKGDKEHLYKFSFFGLNKKIYPTNSLINTSVMKKYGLRGNGNQTIKGVKIYSKNYFSPVDYGVSFSPELSKKYAKKGSYAIHWYQFSWVGPIRRIDRWFGVTGKKIKKKSPQVYRFLKKLNYPLEKFLGFFMS